MIRSARPDDTAAIRKVAENAYRIYVKDLGRPPAPMIADFACHIDRDWVFVVERGNVVAGYAILIVDDRRALLDNLAVDPAHQSRGIGRALIDEVERHVDALGHDVLELYTNVIMTANIDWYRRLGFVETRHVEEHGFRRVYMSKTLTGGPDG